MQLTPSLSFQVLRKITSLYNNFTPFDSTHWNLTNFSVEFPPFLVESIPPFFAFFFISLFAPGIPYRTFSFPCENFIIPRQNTFNISCKTTTVGPVKIRIFPKTLITEQDFVKATLVFQAPERSFYK